MSTANSGRADSLSTEGNHRFALCTTLGVATLYEASGFACALLPNIRAVWPHPHVCGPAFTVQCHPGDNLAIHHALESVPAGAVMVIDAGGHLAGYWGEVMTVAAQSRGVAGLVINGGVRDTEAIARLQFPAFARGIAVFHTVKHEKGQVQIPLQLGGVLIAPGDIIVGDGDGVLALPREAFERVVDRAVEREERERLLMDRLRHGETTMDLYGFGQ